VYANSLFDESQQFVSAAHLLQQEVTDMQGAEHAGESGCTSEYGRAMLQYGMSCFLTTNVCWQCGTAELNYVTPFQCVIFGKCYMMQQEGQGMHLAEHSGETGCAAETALRSAYVSICMHISLSVCM
jgi:hypothetical protein